MSEGWPLIHRCHGWGTHTCFCCLPCPQMTDFTDGGRTKKLKVTLPLEQVQPYVLGKAGEGASGWAGTVNEEM